MPILVFQGLQLPGWLNLAFSSTVVCSLCMSLRRLQRRTHPNSICSVVWGEEKHCMINLRSGEWLDANLGTQAFILPWLVILHFSVRQRQLRYLVLLPDMLAPEVFRKLRVRLKIEMNRHAGQ